MKKSLDKIEKNKSNHGGLRPGSGRPKGSLNKVSKSMREGFVMAFNEMGGVGRMVEWATKNDENLSKFYSLCIKLVPKENWVYPVTLSESIKEMNDLYKID